MIIKLNINDRAALAIKNKTKRVEIRAKTDESKDYSKLSIGDIIEFTSNALGVFYAQVELVNFYNTIEELFTMEGTRYTTSSTSDYNEAIENVNKISEYKEAIKRSGVYAIHIKYLYSENDVWDELVDIALNVRNERCISGMINAGAVGAAVLTSSHHIYTGVCIDTACSLGMCAERNAVTNMITNGDNDIIKLVCIDSKGEVGSPCGACREYLMQVSKNSKDMEILMDRKTKEVIKLEKLIPDWWGYDRV